MNEPATGIPEIHESPKHQLHPLVYVAAQITIIAALIIGVGYFGTRGKPVDVRSRASTDEKGVRASLAPRNPVITNGEFEVTPLLVANAKNIGFSELAIEFNPNETQVIGIMEGSQSDTMEFLIEPDLEEANSTGILRLTLGAFDPQHAPGKTLQLPRIRFTSSARKAFVGVRPEDSVVTFLDEDQAVVYHVDGDAEATVPEEVKSEEKPEQKTEAAAPESDEVMVIDVNDPDPVRPSPATPAETDLPSQPQSESAGIDSEAPSASVDE